MFECVPVSLSFWCFHISATHINLVVCRMFFFSILCFVSFYFIYFFSFVFLYCSTVFSLVGVVVCHKRLNAIKPNIHGLLLESLARIDSMVCSNANNGIKFNTRNVIYKCFAFFFAGVDIISDLSQKFFSKENWSVAKWKRDKDKGQRNAVNKWGMGIFQSNINDESNNHLARYCSGNVFVSCK